MAVSCWELYATPTVPEGNDAGPVRPSEFNVMVPATPLAEIELPLGSEATTSVNWIVIGPTAFGAIWNVAVATTPSVMEALLKPKTTQLMTEHWTVLPAFAADAPGTTVTPVMAAGNDQFHWSPAVCAPPLDAKLMERATEPPALPDPD